MSLRERKLDRASLNLSGSESPGKALRRRLRSESIGANAIGALAVGAIAIGALAIGALAIGRLVIGRTRIRRVEVDELVVRRLHVTEELRGSDEFEAEKRERGPQFGIHHVKA